MKLPAELRNQIYGLALTDPVGIFLISKTKRYRRTVVRSMPFIGRPVHVTHSPVIADYDGPALVPNLLLLNQAIYAETQPILYSGNTFAVEDTMAMHAFLANIGPRNRANITVITLKGWGYSRAHKALNRPALTMLADAVNLRRLNLDCKIAWGLNPKRTAKQVYRDGFHWLEAVGAAKGKFDAGVDIVELAPRNWVYNPGKECEAILDTILDKSREEFNAELRKLLS